MWAIIPLVSFPVSINFSNISSLDNFSYLLVSIIVLILMLSVQFGLIHFRNFKQKITFILTEERTETNGERNRSEPIKKYFADDLISFLKIGLIIGLTSRLLDLINFFNKLEDNSDFLLVTLAAGFFFLLFI